MWTSPRRKQYTIFLYIQLTISFLIGLKRTVKFSKSGPGTLSSCRLYNNHVKDTQNYSRSRVIMSFRTAVHDSVRVIMSRSRALCCLLLVKKQKHDFQVCFVDRARHRKHTWRQGLTKHKRSTKVAKELFADYVKEKKLREPEVCLHV